jgi:hypothetical protein
MTTQATPDELIAYQYKLNRTRRELDKMQERLDQRKRARRMRPASAEKTLAHNQGPQGLTGHPEEETDLAWRDVLKQNAKIWLKILTCHLC